MFRGLPHARAERLAFPAAIDYQEEAAPPLRNFFGNEMAIYDDQWFEFWYSDGVDVLPTYFLIVMPDPKSRGDILVVDPLKNNEVVFRGKTTKP